MTACCSVPSEGNAAHGGVVSDLAVQKERDREREQSQRLHERHTQNERRLDAVGSAGIAADAFERRRGSAPLTEGGSQNGETYREARTQSGVSSGTRGGAGGSGTLLRKGAGRYEGSERGSGEGQLLLLSDAATL
jgi:hypothetical protein